MGGVHVVLSKKRSMKERVSMSKWIAWLSAMLVLAMAASASAAVPFSSVGTFAAAPSDGLVSHHKDLAVRESNGQIFVANTVDDRIDVYAPTAEGATLLTSFGAGTLTDPHGVAVDQSDGAVYVADAGNNRIVKYATDGGATPAFTRVNAPGFTSPAQGTVVGQVDRFDAALAVGPDGNLWVADPGTNRIGRFNADGSYAGTLIDGGGSPASGATGLNGEFTGLRDVAIDATGDVIALDQHGDVLGTSPDDVSRVERFGADGVWKASITGIVNPGAIAAYADGRLAVSTDQNSYNSGALITLVVLAADGSVLQTLALPTDGGLGSAATFSLVTGVAVGGGPAYRTYVATDTDPVGGVYGAIAIQAYEVPPPTKPTISSPSANPAYTSAGLTARIDPRFATTTYHFEYGTTSTYGSSTASETIGAEDPPTLVTTNVDGLSAGATYHFRVVAGNAVGETVGPDRTFTTLARAASDGCPNAGIRDAQHAGFLVDCRAWEVVSPAEKNGGDAGGGLSNVSSVQSSLTGDGVAYFSEDAFADSASSQVANAYVASRGSSGWSSRSVLPPTTQDAGGCCNGSSLSGLFSRDLSQALVSSATKLTPDTPQGFRNLFVRDVAAGSYRLVTLFPPLNAIPGYAQLPEAIGASADFRHVLVRSPLALTPDAPTGASYNIYEGVAGSPATFRLVGRLPDGSVDPAGAAPGSAGSGAVGGGGSVYRAISTDGARIFFSSPAGSSTIYLRENGALTTQITAGGKFWAATPDGSRVLLTDAVGLQRYDVASQATTTLSSDGEPADGSDAQVLGVVGASDDLSRVYFTASGQLVAGKGVPGRRNLYLSTDGDVRFITTLSDGDAQYSLDSVVGFPTLGQRAVSSDGRRLAFVSTGQLTDYDNDGNPEVYVYDDTTATLSCPSCAGPPGSSRLVADSGTNQFASLNHPQHNFSANGARLFFQSTKSLVPADTNGVTDVYVWQDGRAQLISGGGGGRDGSLFMGASPSGDDVFFTTRERLVSQDDDGSRDLYTARVGGGFEPVASPAAPCSGDGCRAQSSAPPVLPVAASVTFAGSANTPQVSRVGKATVSKARSISGTAGKLAVTVPARGKLAVSGARLRSASMRVTKPGSVRLTVRLSASAAKTLRRQRRLVVSARVTYTPSAGGSSTTVVKLTFKQPAKVKTRRGATA